MVIGRVFRWIGRNPLPLLAAVTVAGAWGAIGVNALFLQSGPHPAPFLSRAPGDGPATGRRVSEIAPRALVDAEQRLAEERRRAMIADLQAELGRRAFYTGPLDGLFGPQTAGAIRAYEQAAGLAETGEATDALLAHVRLSVLTAPPVPQPNPNAAAPAPADHAALTALIEQTGTAPLPPVSPRAAPAAGTGAPGAPGTGAAAADGAGGSAPAPAAARPPAEPPTVKTVVTTTIPVPPPAPDAAQATDSAQAPDPRIEAVQSILADLGYAPGSIDGRLGPDTRAAIRDFEIDRGLPETGEISRSLLDELTVVSGVRL